MARKKVKIAWITTDASRKATFKKRKRGLMKKVDELSTLCGVNACAIVYNPYDVQPETWPAPYAEAHRIMVRFKDLPDMEQSKKMIDQEGFLTERIHKMKEQQQHQQQNKTEYQMEIEAAQRQTWFMDQKETMNNPHEQMGNYFEDHSHHQEQNTQQVAGVGAAAAAPFNDHNNNKNPWSNSLFP